MTEGAFTLEGIRSDVAVFLGTDPEQIAVDDDLFDHGLDSVRLMALVERWRSAGAATVEFPDLAERPRLDEWLTMLDTATARSTDEENP